MTGYLFDTHVVIWLALAPQRIPANLLDQLREPEAELFTSPVTAMEIATKHRIGKLIEAEPLLHGYRAHLRRLGTTPLPLADEHALLAGSLAWEHRDPFDRLLAAQAITEGLALVSADTAFKQLPGLCLRSF